MKFNNKRAFKGIMLLMLSMGTLSCKKTFDLLPQDALDYSQAYQNVFDADAAVMGLYGKFTRIADKYLVLNELRADLEDVTPNSDNYLREISEHNASAANPWASPRPYYEIIINCNDVMKNLDIMLANKRLSQKDYDIRYSEVGALRTWLYLQLGIHYGSVPYITDDLQSIEAAQDQTKYPKLSFDELLSTLTNFMQGLPTLLRMPAGTSLLNTIDGYNPAKIFINKEQLVGDLYLWQGNYPMASKFYKRILNYYGGENLLFGNDTYAMLTLGTNASELATNGSNWIKIFNQGFGERVQNNEMINLIPFDKNFAPVNPFIKLYAPNSYLIKPSEKAIQNWRNETRSDGSPGDVTRGSGVSYLGTVAPYIYKLIPNYNPGTPFETTGKWIINRAGDLTLKFMESANRDGRDSLAYAFLNQSLKSTYSRKILPAVIDKTKEMQSFDSNPDYYFDARNGDSPNYRRIWSYQLGVRGRAGLADAKVDSIQFFDMTQTARKSYINYHKALLPGKEAAFRNAMEDLFIKEQALESAFEGHRWPTLLRFALRREKEAPGTGRAFLKAAIAAKFTAAGKTPPEGVNKLGDDVKNWYLPFNF